MQQTFPESIDGITEKLTQLETYLATNGATYPEQYLYYLRQRATHRKDVSANEVRQLIANNSLDLSTANVLAFGIATALGEDARSRELVAKIDRETLGSGNQQEAYGYGVYIDSTILQAIYLRALLKFDP
ncbi:MAG: hypothetical protein Q8O99_04645 [bacterium]|nr:hypothetical protein [bacterium]